MLQFVSAIWSDEDTERCCFPLEDEWISLNVKSDLKHHTFSASGWLVSAAPSVYTPLKPQGLNQSPAAHAFPWHPLPSEALPPWEPIRIDSSLMCRRERGAGGELNAMCPRWLHEACCAHTSWRFSQTVSSLLRGRAWKDSTAERLAFVSLAELELSTLYSSWSGGMGIAMLAPLATIHQPESFRRGMERKEGYK